MEELSEQELRERAALVSELGRALQSKATSIDTIHDMVKEIIVKKKWLRFLTKDDEEVVYKDTAEDFIRFVTSPRDKNGLGTKLETIELIVSRDTEALKAFNAAKRRKRGKLKHDNIMIKRAEQGTSKAYALQRLEDEGRYDLLDRVQSGTLSAHAAMKQAGFRKGRIAIALDDPLSAANTIRSHASPEFIAELRRLLE